MKIQENQFHLGIHQKQMILLSKIFFLIFFRQGNHRKSLKTRKNINDKFSNPENELKVINKPSFSRFLFNTFSTFANTTKESQDIDFTKFNVDSSLWALNKKKFQIAKTKKNGSTDINSYYDIVYNGAADLNIWNSNLNIIENRVENTFKFNSERVIDSVIRSNKKQNDDIIMNETMKNVGFSSPIKKFKNIFKNLKTNNESKENSNSNSFVNEEVKLNNKNPNNKKRINLLTIKINPTIENNSTKNYNKTETYFRNQTKDIKDLRSNSSLHTEYIQSSKHPPNSNGIDFQNSIKLQNKSNSFKNFQMNNSHISKFTASLATEKNINLKTSNKEQNKSHLDLNKTNDNRKLKGLVSLKTLDSIETKNTNMILKNHSYLNEYKEKRSESENNLNQNTILSNKNFILKNIKLAKNYSRKNKTNNEELTIKRELKKKFHSLLTNDCQSFCIELKVKNQNFKEKINNHLISEKYSQKLKDFHKNIHFKGMSYNPLRYLINLETIEKNFLTPEQVISEKLSPAELKIIQSDVGYFIKDPALIKENPDLKIKSLKDLMKEEEEIEIKKKHKKKNHLPFLDKVMVGKKEEHLKLTKKSFSSEENFFRTDLSKKKNFKNKSKENIISLLSSDQDRGFPRIDLINKQFERMYFDVEKKVGNKVLNENILNDNFDNFNSKLQDKIIRKGYEKQFSAIPMRNPGDDLEPNQKHDYYIAKMANRNENYDKKVNDIYQKIGEKFVENNFVKSCINKLKQNFNYVRTNFIITDEAKQILTNPIYKQIGIISLVGKYRTGKSFLLNRVLLNEKKEKGFVVGPTIKPCTKGIWMWSKPVLVENIHSKEKFYTFFIDTEGLGAYDEEINHDSKIFLIAILISSLFILNTFGNIDENAINSLSFIINLSKTIKLNQFSNESNPDELSAYFPSFLWLLRDFSLKLEDTFGNVITAKQYLENALQLQKGSSETIEEKNKIRKLITTYFKERDCFSMVRPIENEIDLQNLQSLDDTLIRKEFLDQAETLRNKVFKKVKPKIFNNKTLSGSMLIELLDNIIDAINKGAVPVIENSWKYMLHNESLKNMNICLLKFRNRINEFKDKHKDNPNFFKDLKKFKDEMIDATIQDFKRESISSDSPETKEYIDKLKTKIQQEFEKFNDDNSRLFENKLNDEIDKNFKKIYDVFETDKYIKNYNLLFKDLENLKELLETSIPDFKNKKEVINEKIINIIKKFIEVNLVKNKLNYEKEITILKNENSNQQNKLNLKNEEYEKLKLESSNVLEKLNTAYKELKLKEKTFEEKFGQLLTEKKKVNATADEKIDSMKIEMNSKIEKLKFDLCKAEADLKNKDDYLRMAKFSEDKMNALNSQKLEYLEREILSYKERIDSLKYDNAKLKSTVEEQYEKIDELKNQLNKKSLLEMENERLKKDNENILMKSRSSNLFGNSNNPLEVNEGLILCASGNSSNKMSSPTKIKNLDPNSDAYTLLELLKEVLNNQSSEQNNNLCGFAESVKNMVERISRENEEYIVLNKNLTENQLNFEKRYNSLELRYENLNYIKNVLKQALTIQCKNCKKLIENETFINSHHNNCKINKESNAFSNNNDKLRIKILKGILHKDELGRPFIEYILEIIYNKQIWRVNKKFNQFANLHKSIKNMMNEDFIFPQSANMFVKIVDKNNFHEDKIKQLESYVREISEIPLISNSKIFKRFFEFHLNHQDEYLEEYPENIERSDPLRNSYKKSNFSKSGYKSDGTDSYQEEAKINNHNFNTFKNSSNYSSHRNNFYADSEGRITFENNNSAQKTKDWR